MRRGDLQPEPTQWQLMQALPAPVEPYTDEPGVDVFALAQGDGPDGGELDPTIDVQINDEIIAKAAELGTPLAIYEFVRNECRFQAYFGSRKGSIETLRTRAGNDYDLASLLIALLRASGVPARYAVGQVQMTAAAAKSWLAVDDAEVAGSILFTHGMEGLNLVDGGGSVVAVRARRVWVEALTPIGYGSAVWVPLDPAFVQQAVVPGQDIPLAMGFDALDFVDEYFDPSSPAALPRPETVVDLFEQAVQDFLDVAEPGTSVGDVRRTSSIVPLELGTLPLSLPYTVRTRDTVYSEIPANRRYQVRFHLYDGGTDMIDHTFDLPAIAGRRVTIDYVGATPGDQAILDANGGIYQTPPSSVSLKPVLRLDGVDQATGAAGIMMGLLHNSDVHFLEPTNGFGMPVNVVPAIFNVIIAGAAEAHAIAIDGNAEGMLVPPPASDTEGLASLWFDHGKDYLSNVRKGDERVAELMHGYLTTGVTNAIVQNVVKVTYNGFGVPQTFDWKGLLVDADRAVIGYWPVDGLQPSHLEPKDFLVVSGAEGSLWESKLYEDYYGQDAVSTIKILELAVDQGITVYKHWDTLPLPPNTQPAGVTSALTSAILSGNEVTFPADPMTVGTLATGQWTGTGWISMDPTSGAAGYIISGGNNGGSTVETWPPEFIDLSEGDKTVVKVEVFIKGGVSPTGDSPAPESIYTRDNEQNLVFEYQVVVTYDDASTKTLPSATTYYQRKTTNTTKTFAPGNYKFTVWISKQVWWIFTTTLAQAERNVSIVGVLVREDDGSEFGADPPKLIEIKPPSGSTDTKKLLALVIPEKAPDGSTNLATAFAWSGGSKLTFKTASAQKTDLEASGPTPSSALDDQDVNVDVTLVGGKTSKGYRKFNFTKGGTDEPHKMTVYVIEIDKVPSAFLPQGGSADNTVSITARALPNALKGQFEFELFDVSEENGYASNAPSSLPFLPLSEDGSTFNDLQFEDQAGFDIDGIFETYRATTDATTLDTATVVVQCYDYGAYGKIKVVFYHDDMELAGREKNGTKLHTNIPLDDDDNHIADGWAHAAGGANDDADATPAGNGTAGDNLGRFEEYRGFMHGGAHIRTDPNQKDVFVRDENSLGVGYFGGLGYSLHISLTADEMGSGQRINFRGETGHVADMRAILLQEMPAGTLYGATTGRIDTGAVCRCARPDILAAGGTAQDVDSHIAHELGHAVYILPPSGGGHGHTPSKGCIMDSVLTPSGASPTAFCTTTVGTDAYQCVNNHRLH